MKLVATLPPDRETEGVFSIVDEGGVVLLGPRRCRGEADNTNAARAGNVVEDPTKIGGDHPYGVYRVGRVIQAPQPVETYGPFFIRLAPVSGEALEAWQRGRRGIGIHGGQLGPGSTLRPTFGCLRLDNESLERAAKYVLTEQLAGRDVFYECAPPVP